MQNVTALQKTPAIMLDQLCEKWAQAKDAESMANAQRLAVEQQIVDWVGEQPPEGSNKLHGDLFQLTVTGKITRTLDSKSMLANAPELINKVATIKYALDTRLFKALKSANPEAYSLVAHYITEKPAKPSFAVKYISKDVA